MIGWKPVPDALNYVLYHSEDGTTYRKLIRLPKNMNTYYHRGLAKEGTHYYKLSIINEYGNEERGGQPIDVVLRKRRRPIAPEEKGERKERIEKKAQGMGARAERVPDEDEETEESDEDKEYRDRGAQEGKETEKEKKRPAIIDRERL